MKGGCRALPQGGVPADLAFEIKPALAMHHIEAALEAGYSLGVVLADAVSGDYTGWREQLAGHGLSYALAICPGTTAWWG